jgi:glycosyltransferase involved in cell wall biosynthesis
MFTAREQVVMVHYGPYLDPLGGGTKADRCILEYLAAQGFPCTAVIPASHSTFVELPNAGAQRAITGGVIYEQANGVDVHVVYEDSIPDYRRHQRLLQHIERLIDLAPSWIFLTGSDRGHQILKRVVKKTAGRNVIYIPRATAELPMGPNCLVEDSNAVRAMTQVHTVLCASEYMAQYLKTWCCVDAYSTDVPVYGRPPYPNFAGTGSYITIINPCGIKGIDIFLALAKRHQEWSFAAVPTWATTQADRERLRGAPNVLEMKPSSDIDDVLREALVVIVPSLWDEAFGRIVIEAMLRGIPVLASDIGGLPEAKLGVPYLLPVNPVESYYGLDARTRTPLARVPPQNIEPWNNALLRLCDDPAHYTEISQASRIAAISYAAKLNLNIVDQVMSRPNKNKPLESPSIPVVRQMANVSAERRAALLLNLRKRKLLN